MTIGTVRRLAADILNVGQNKVRINPEGLKEAEGALTRADVRGLIEKGVITKLKPKGRASTGKTGRRGRGRRRGTPVDSKSVWMMKIRAQRRFLVMLIESGALKKESKRAIYFKTKSGIFRNKKAMLLYLKENKLVAADYEPVKKEYKKPEAKTQKVKSEPAKAKERKPGTQAPEQKTPERKIPEQAGARMKEGGTPEPKAMKGEHGKEKGEQR